MGAQSDEEQDLQNYKQSDAALRTLFIRKCTRKKVNLYKSSGDGEDRSEHTGGNLCRVYLDTTAANIW